MSPAILAGVLVLSGCASMTAPRDEESVTEIALERDCSGCATGTTVTLRRDGTATRHDTGKARFRTEDRTFTGSVERADFERLASLLLARGFFDLQDEYRDPDVVDGEWITTSAVRHGSAKKVVDSNGAGPPALKAIEEAIEGVRASIAWTAASP